jgi:hypothetical protein
MLRYAIVAYSGIYLTVGNDQISRIDPWLPKTKCCWQEALRGVLFLKTKIHVEND